MIGIHYYTELMLIMELAKLCDPKIRFHFWALKSFMNKLHMIITYTKFAMNKNAIDEQLYILVLIKIIPVC